MKHNQYVLPNDDTWMVMDDTGYENTCFFSSMIDAIHYAHITAANCRAEVTVCDSDLSVLSIVDYAKDPDQL